jgi:hypothetical protein
MVGALANVLGAMNMFYINSSLNDIFVLVSILKTWNISA